MALKNYGWKKGYRGAKSNIDVVKKELEDIEKKNGTISAQAVVERARPEDSVLHKFFEWDDAVAAEQHRLAQARHLINMVVVEVKNKSDEPLITRAYVEVDNKNGYRSLSVVVKSPSLRSQLLLQAQKDIEIFAAKYAVLIEVTELLKPLKEKIVELINK
jgi:ppGpp synthetase/RelA/SpoT-type nucleotidyltranferase